MTCKSCVHHRVCGYRLDYETDVTNSKCSHFRQKCNYVEVVRCKDCKYFKTPKWGDDMINTCREMSGCLDVHPDGYCSYGIRKGGKKCDSSN